MKDLLHSLSRSAPVPVIAISPVAIEAPERGQVLHVRVFTPDWRADAYRLSPPGKCLLTLFEAEHSLGGIAGYESRETTAENPARIAGLQQLTWAYLRSTFYPNDPAWPAACAALRVQSQPLGQSSAATRTSDAHRSEAEPANR